MRPRKKYDYSCLELWRISETGILRPAANTEEPFERISSLLGSLSLSQGTRIWFPLTLSELEQLTNCTDERFLSHFREGLPSSEADAIELQLLARKLKRKSDTAILVTETTVSFLRRTHREGKKNGFRTLIIKPIQEDIWNKTPSENGILPKNP